MGLSTNYKVKKLKDGRVVVIKQPFYRQNRPKYLMRLARQFIKRKRVFVLLFLLFPYSPTHLLTYSLNLNTATRDELKALPGIGDRRADAIISYRESQGGFKTVDELNNVGGVPVERLSQFVTLYAVPKDEWESKRVKQLEYLQRPKLRIWEMECDGLMLYVEFPDGGNALAIGRIKNIPALLRKDPNKFLKQHIISDDYIRKTAGLFGWKPRLDRVIFTTLNDASIEILSFILKDLTVWELYVPIDTQTLLESPLPPMVSRLYAVFPPKKQPEVFSLFDEIKIRQSRSKVRMSAIADGNNFMGLGLIYDDMKIVIEPRGKVADVVDIVIPSTPTDGLTITDGVLIYEVAR